MKKVKQPPQEFKSVSKKSFSESIFTKDNIAVLLISLYLLVDFLPQLNSADVMGPQWLYLSVLNMAVSSYILLTFYNNSINIIEKFSSDKLSICYTAVFFLCGVSIFFAANQVESLVVYARFVVAIIAFFNIVILLHDRITSAKYIWQVVTIGLLIQCIPTLFTFFQGIGDTQIRTLIDQLKGVTGNKNILASSLIVKLPFVIYCTLNFPALWQKVINISTLTLAALIIFLLIARAAYLALFVQIFILLIFAILSYRQTNSLKTLYSYVKIVIPLFIAFSISQILFNYSETSQQAKGLSITERLSTITSEDGSARARLFFWKNSIDYIKKHPVTGAGYGNWKLVSVPYENVFNNDFDYSKHVHNDFLEITAEAGIPTGIIFFTIFICAFIYTVKIWYSEASDTVKAISVFGFISLAGYFFDAFFNFPAERPIMQVFFVFNLALLVVIFTSVRKDIAVIDLRPFKTTIFLTCFLLMTVSLYFNYSTFRSMRAQWYTYFDFGQPGTPLSWQQINGEFPSIPNLGENNVPIDVIKAWYLYKGQQYKDAMELLNRSKNVNPYSMINEWVKASVFLAMNQPDSAYYYTKKGFFTRPRNTLLFTALAKIGAIEHDTATIKSAFREYLRYRNNEPHAWKLYLRGLFAANYNQNGLLPIVDSLAQVYPNNPEILHTKFFIHAGVAAMQKDFSTALVALQEIEKISPTDYENLENIGLTYYYTQDFTNAAIYFDTVVKSKAFNNGKSEFYLGLSLHQIGDKTEGCRYLLLAASKKFPDAARYLALNCK